MSAPDQGRPFGVWTASALVVGSIIGTGIFLIPAALAPYGGTGIASWSVTIIGTLLLGFVYVRLTALRPLASGSIAICSEVLGPLPGVLVGWAYWLSNIGAMAAMATGATSYLSTFAPAITATPLRGALFASALTAAVTAINLGSTRAAGRFQIVTTILKILPLLAIVVILARLGPMGGAGTVAPSAPLPGKGVAMLPATLSTLTGAVAFTFFTMTGFETGSVVAARVKRPEVNVFRATMFGILGTGLLFLFVCGGILLALPADRVAASPAPFGLFVETYWGHGPALAIAAFAAIAAIGCLNGWVLVQGEIPIAMAQEGGLPAWFGRVDARGIPVGVMTLSSLLVIVLVMSNASKSLANIYVFVALLSTAACLWFYAAACLAALRLRIARVPAVLGLLFCGWVMWGTGLAVSLLSLVLMLTALPLYLMRPRAAAPLQDVPAGMAA